MIIHPNEVLDIKERLNEINNQIKNFTEANNLIADREAAFKLYDKGEISFQQYEEKYDEVEFELRKIGYNDLIEEKIEFELELKEYGVDP